MSRVLLTGGAGTIGAAVARRLLADPAYDVRIADRRPAPQWMREGCEINDSDLRSLAQAQAATKGCSHVIHLGAFDAARADAASRGHSLLEFENAVHNALIRAAVERHVERFVYVSSGLVFERAELFPTPEEHLAECPAPRSPLGFSRLSGERYCRAAAAEHGFPFTICRPAAVYGASEQSAERRDLGAPLDPTLDRTIVQALEGVRPIEIAGSSERKLAPTHVEDVADGIVAAMVSAAGLHEDFNLCAPRELTIAEVACIAWSAAGADPKKLALKQLGDGGDAPARSWQAAEKARELLGWSASVDAEEGIAATVQTLLKREAAREPPAAAAA